VPGVYSRERTAVPCIQSLLSIGAPRTHSVLPILAWSPLHPFFILKSGLGTLEITLCSEPAGQSPRRTCARNPQTRRARWPGACPPLRSSSCAPSPGGRHRRPPLGAVSSLHEVCIVPTQNRPWGSHLPSLHLQYAQGTRGYSTLRAQEGASPLLRGQAQEGPRGAALC